MKTADSTSRLASVMRLDDAPARPEDAARETAIRIETVARSSPKNLMTGIVAALLISSAATLGDDTGRLHGLAPWIWFALLAIGLVRGALMSHRFNSSPRSEPNSIAFGGKIVRNGMYCGLVWGTSSWLMLPNQNAALLIVTMAMVFMGGAASQAIYRPLLLWFEIPTAAVFTFGLWRIDGLFYGMLGVAFWLLCFVIIAAARTQENAVTQSIRFRFQTEALLRERIEQQKVTDAARAEAEQARMKAELADQGKTTFLAAASHDLRQPMHALVQYYAVLHEGNKDPELTDTVTRMGRALDAMQELLDSILEVSKLMMGSVKPHETTFPMQTIFERLDAQLRPLAVAKGLTLTVEHCRARVTTDMVLLERILRNIMLNAIRYTERGGIRTQCRTCKSHLRVQVWDTGIGIPRNEQEKIFEAFYQVANEARDRRKGLGLGLNLVKQLAELLGQRITVRSVQGKGSVFSVEIPLTRDLGSDPVETEGVAKADFVNGAFVVLIDDDDLSLEATAATVARFGCRVLTASSGIDAIAKLQNQEFMPQLIISDYRLGAGETGIDAVEMVTQNQRALFGEEFALPALLVTGDTAPAELTAVTNAGLQMLHKPVKPRELYLAMNEKLEQLMA